MCCDTYYIMKQSTSKVSLSIGLKVPPISHCMSNRPLVVHLSVVMLSCDEKYHSGKSHLSSFPDHDIVVVTISNAQDISSYTVASAGQRELFYCLIKFVPGDKKKKRSEK